MDQKYESRFTDDPDVLELGRVEDRIQRMAKSGELFEPDSLEGDEPTEPSSKAAQKLLERREELIEKVRPQCVDAEGYVLAAEVEKIAKEEFGLEDWAKVNEVPEE